MAKQPRSQLYRLPIRTPDGQFLALYSPSGLCGLRFPSGAKRRRRTSRALASVPAQIRLWHATTSKALAQALFGQAPDQLPPLDFSAGTTFQQQVWQTLRQIPWGHTCSYTQLARAIGRPKAARAVGGACGANPVPVLVPCHRVLAANDRLGGFSGGLNWKRALLAREAICAAPPISELRKKYNLPA